jgi:predicted enzyme related to lactoylglutathione lyase
MDQTTNAINWFEIPVTDMARARHFYQVIFSIHMQEMEIANFQMAMFPFEGGNGKASGALVRSEMHQPSQSGVLVYLNANPNMDDVLKRIEQEGAQIIMPKTQIDPETGYMAFFIDTEGNRIGLHSQE